MIEDNTIFIAIISIIIGFVAYAIIQTIMNMRKYPMVPKNEEKDWKRLDDIQLTLAAKNYYRDSASIQLKENKEGDENYVKVDPTPHENDEKQHVAFAFKNEKTGEVRFFKGEQYREWSTRDDVPTIDTSDIIKNHVISIAISILIAVCVYLLLIHS